MSKQIPPNELAEIVVGLLNKPELFNELTTPLKHQEFMLDIGKVIAFHTGGNITRVNDADTHDNYLSDDYSSPLLAVVEYENTQLWKAFDVQADCEIHEEEMNALRQEDVELRQRLQTLLIGDETFIPFQLSETSDEHDPQTVGGQFMFNADSVHFRFDGHSDHGSQDDKGIQISFDLFEGQIDIRIWEDITIEDPTYRLNLKNSRIENRS